MTTDTRSEITQTDRIEQLLSALPRLDRIEHMLTALLERETTKEFYSTDEFARRVGKAEFTVREWCRLGRVRGTKRKSGRGGHTSWAISHDEILRYQRDGLLPDRLAGLRR